jgi:hypothetical protein
MILNHISFANLINSNEMTKKNEPKDFFVIICKKEDWLVLWYRNSLFIASIFFDTRAIEPGMVR